APITLPTFPEKVPLAPLMNFAIVTTVLKFTISIIYSLPVFRCTGTMTDGGKHSKLKNNKIDLSPRCHAMGSGLSPNCGWGDRNVPILSNDNCRKCVQKRRITGGYVGAFGAVTLLYGCGAPPADRQQRAGIVLR